jgi:septal ring factor EnvC (AmiA/AmiB activator)
MMSLAIHVLFFPVVVAGAIVVPIEGEVVRRFDRPLCMYCPGHRGVTIDSNPGDEVLALAGGFISFAGEVGGRLYVVQSFAPDIRVTYGGVLALGVDVQEGEWVDAGQVVAIADDSTYLGVRIGQEYIEPLRFLGLGQVRLGAPGPVVVGTG